MIPCWSKHFGVECLLHLILTEDNAMPYDAIYSTSSPTPARWHTATAKQKQIKIFRIFCRQFAVSPSVVCFCRSFLSYLSKNNHELVSILSWQLTSSASQPVVDGWWTKRKAKWGLFVFVFIFIFMAFERGGWLLGLVAKMYRHFELLIDSLLRVASTPVCF